MNAAPVRRSRIVPSACRKCHVLYRSMPRDSRTSAGTQDNSAPVSTKTDLKARLSPGRAGFSISTSTRKDPISSRIIAPEVLPSSTLSLRGVSIPWLACVPAVGSSSRPQQQVLRSRAFRALAQDDSRARVWWRKRDGRSGGVPRTSVHGVGGWLLFFPSRSEEPVILSAAGAKDLLFARQTGLPTAAARAGRARRSSP